MYISFYYDIIYFSSGKRIALYSSLFRMLAERQVHAIANLVTYQICKTGIIDMIKIKPIRTTIATTVQSKCISICSVRVALNEIS